MTQDKWIEEMIKEMKKLEEERRLIEIEYNNYMQELQNIKNDINNEGYTHQQE